MNATKASELIAGSLIILFMYTAASKLIAFHDFKGQMYNQTLPRPLETALIWLLPPVEIFTSLLLVFDRSRLAGLWASFTLLGLFSGYIGLVVSGFYDRVPCSCGGVFKNIEWTAHLALNLFFLLLSVIAIYLLNRERRVSNFTV